MQQNHCMNALTSELWFFFWGGGGAKWTSNHFRLYTVRCICTEAQEMRAPCMFDWQGTQTSFSRWNAKSQIRSLVCTLVRNSNIAITSLVCTLRNSKCAIQMIIQITQFALLCHCWSSQQLPSLPIVISLSCKLIGTGISLWSTYPMYWLAHKYSFNTRLRF